MTKSCRLKHSIVLPVQQAWLRLRETREVEVVSRSDLVTVEVSLIFVSTICRLIDIDRRFIQSTHVAVSTKVPVQLPFPECVTRSDQVATEISLQ